jgi:hypothetical protein
MKRALTALGVLAVAASACATPKRYVGPDAADGATDAESDALPTADRPESDSPAPSVDGRPGDVPAGPPDAATDQAPPGDGPCGSAGDPRNCGTCGHDCTKLANVSPGAPVTCQGGHCSIPASSCAIGYGHCGASPADNGCETNITVPQSCGCTPCLPGQTCQQSGASFRCACGPTKPTLCETGCSNLNEDALNCGSCGHSCLGGPCANGACQPLQIYAGSDATYAYAVDSNFIYFIREKSQGLRVISRISKVDGSGLQDIWATDIGPFQNGLVLVNGMIYWAGEFDIMGCPAPNCAAGPLIQVANQANVKNMFSDVSKTHLFWSAADTQIPNLHTLMQLGVPAPLTTTTYGFGYGTADANFAYVTELDEILQIALKGGAKTPLGKGYASVINSTKVIFAVDTPVLPSGFSPAITSVLQSPLGASRTTIGNYGTLYSVWGGIVVDEQDVYWLINGEQKGTSNNYAFIFKCPLSGCGTAPTILAQGQYPVGVLKTDGQALFTAGDAGIFKLAK